MSKPHLIHEVGEVFGLERASPEHIKETLRNRAERDAELYGFKVTSIEDYTIHKAPLMMLICRALVYGTWNSREGKTVDELYGDWDI